MDDDDWPSMMITDLTCPLVHVLLSTFLAYDLESARGWCLNLASSERILMSVKSITAETQLASIQTAQKAIYAQRAKGAPFG